MKVLDDVEKIKNKTTFSILSLVFSIVSIISFLYLMSQIPSKVNAREGLPQPSMLLINVMRMSCLLSVILALISLVKKEPWGIYKWVSTIVSVICFIGLIALIMFPIIVRMQ